MGNAKILRLMVAGVAVSAAMLYAVSTVGAQSVPVTAPAPSTSAPANPPQGTPPQSPIEPPANGGNVGGAGSGPARLPSAGTGNAANGSGSSELMLLAGLGAIIAGVGLAGTRVAGRDN